MRKEHEFNTTRENWEKVVFEEAAYFTVCRRFGRGNMDKQEYISFIEAVTDAASGPPLPKPMVYAVTEIGRFVMLPKSEWIILLKEYAAREIQKEDV